MNPAYQTLGELKTSGYQPKSIKEEIRQNLIHRIKQNQASFDNIFGFDDTVIPDLERAILSRHNILLLGLRGQAKTKIARLMIQLLDEYIPTIAGSEIHDDPFQPISKYGIDLIREMGDQTPISWLHRSERYVEKLATPDVSIADLIGDVDPIKAATLKLPYSDERVIHFGLIPRAHRCIFVINELPDLQARIQVSLFNILQEGDLQIRGFKLRLPLDVQFVFTANPEDYTNRGSIITPLKDRIESQILTHYPRSIETAKKITLSQANIHPHQHENVEVHPFHHTLLETLVFKARESELIDTKSGVSARLSISAYENLASGAERRSLKNGDLKTTTRIADFWGIIPAITGKVELVYEGEQEGPYEVAIKLMNEAIQEVFLDMFPHPGKIKSGKTKDPYGAMKLFFGDGNTVTILQDMSNEEFQQTLLKIPGMRKFLDDYNILEKDQAIFAEFVLHGLHQFEIVGRSFVHNRLEFSDPLSSMFDQMGEEDDDQ